MAKRTPSTPRQISSCTLRVAELRRHQAPFDFLVELAAFDERSLFSVADRQVAVLYRVEHQLAESQNHSRGSGAALAAKLARLRFFRVRIAKMAWERQPESSGRYVWPPLAISSCLRRSSTAAPTMANKVSAENGLRG